MVGVAVMVLVGIAVAYGMVVVGRWCTSRAYALAERDGITARRRGEVVAQQQAHVLRHVLAVGAGRGPYLH